MPRAVKRDHQTYDHRLQEIVRISGDPGVVARYGVPRSTSHGWRRKRRRPVVTAEEFDLDHVRLQAEVL